MGMPPTIAGFPPPEVAGKTSEIRSWMFFSITEPWQLVADGHKGKSPATGGIPIESVKSDRKSDAGVNERHFPSKTVKALLGYACP